MTDIKWKYATKLKQDWNFIYKWLSCNYEGVQNWMKNETITESKKKHLVKTHMSHYLHNYIMIIG